MAKRTQRKAKKAQRARGARRPRPQAGAERPESAATAAEETPAGEEAAAGEEAEAAEEAESAAAAEASEGGEESESAATAEASEGGEEEAAAEESESAATAEETGGGGEEAAAEEAESAAAAEASEGTEEVATGEESESADPEEKGGQQIDSGKPAGAEQTELPVAEDSGPSPRLLSILESLLFASDKPLKVPTLKRLLGERSAAKVKQALRALQQARADSGIQVVEVDGGFQLRTHPDNAQWVRRLADVKPVRMSRAALEVLSVVAYRQPVTRAEIDQIRGVDSGAVLKLLLTRELVRIVGRKDEPGRPFLYGTTHEFLSFFGLASLSDLPSLRDVSELAREQVEASKVPGPEEPLEGTQDPEGAGAGRQQSDAMAEGTAGEERSSEDSTGEGAGPEDSGAAAEADAEDIDLAGEVDEMDEGDEELLEALSEATDAVRGAERVRRSLRKMAAEQAEAVAPDSEAGKMLSSLTDVVAARRRKKARREDSPQSGQVPAGDAPQAGVSPDGDPDSDAGAGAGQAPAEAASGMPADGGGDR